MSDVLIKSLGYPEFEMIAERFYARVYRVPAGRIIKIVTGHKKLLPEGFSTKSEASHFGTEVFTYMEKLAGLGLPISPIQESSIWILSDPKTGRPSIVFDVLDGGASAETLLEQCDSPNVLRELCEGMINSILPVLSQPRLVNGYPEVGIDPIASNFTRAKDGRMVYIDFTPPRYFSPDRGYRIEHPQPTCEAEVREAVWRYYEPCGIVTRWLTDCCRIRPEARKIFLGCLSESLPGTLWRHVKSHLYSSRLPNNPQTLDWQAAITLANQPMDLRDLACAVAATDGTDPAGTKQWLGDFYNASRHHPGQPIPDEWLGPLRTQLLERITLH